MISLVTPEGMLPSRDTPLVFETTEKIVHVAVELSTESGPVRECVFDGTDADNDGGTFADLYQTSEIDGDTWRIRRNGGWPCPAQLRIKPASTGAASGQAAGLTPTLYSPLAQWALQGAPDTARLYLDRSGNSRHLTAGSGTATPDRLTGQTAVTNANLTATIAALALNAAMTLTMRVKPADLGAYQALLDVGNVGSTSNYYLARNASGMFDYAVSTVSGFGSTLLIPDAEWSFLSLRRSSSTDVTLGVNGVYQSGVTSSPATGSSGIVILGTVEGGASYWHGAMADVSIWGTRLTNAELAAVQSVVMGQV